MIPIVSATTAWSVMVLWLALITMSLYRDRPFSDFIFLHTCDGFVFPLMEDVYKFHDFFFTDFYEEFAFGSESFEFDKIFGCFIFFEIFRALFLLEIASFILSFHQGTLGFFV